MASRPPKDLKGQQSAFKAFLLGSSTTVGRAEGLEAFNQLLQNNTDFVLPSDTRRKELQGLKGAFLSYDNAWGFETSFWPHQAKSLDPEGRLLLSHCFLAMENALVTDLAGASTGVFLGMWNNYHRVYQGDTQVPQVALSSGWSKDVERIAKMLNLQGPAVVVDGDFASGMLALSAASESLERRGCTTALVGAANIIPSKHLYNHFGQALSAQGRCRSFDAAADGYVRSEACGVLYMGTEKGSLAVGGCIVDQDNARSMDQLITSSFMRSGMKDVHLIEADGVGHAPTDAV
jgi:acyl transferase domain-containing protein